MSNATRTRGFEEISAHQLNHGSNPKTGRLVVIGYGERFFRTGDPKLVLERVQEAYDWTEWMVPTVDSRFMYPGGLLVCMQETLKIDRTKPSVAAVTIDMLKAVTFNEGRNLMLNLEHVDSRLEPNPWNPEHTGPTVRADFLFANNGSLSYGEALNIVTRNAYSLQFYSADGGFSTPVQSLEVGGFIRRTRAVSEQVIPVGEIVILSQNIYGDAFARAFRITDDRQD